MWFLLSTCRLFDIIWETQTEANSCSFVNLPTGTWALQREIINTIQIISTRSSASLVMLALCAVCQASGESVGSITGDPGYLTWTWSIRSLAQTFTWAQWCCFKNYNISPNSAWAADGETLEQTDRCLHSASQMDLSPLTHLCPLGLGWWGGYELKPSLMSYPCLLAAEPLQSLSNWMIHFQKCCEEQQHTVTDSGIRVQWEYIVVLLVSTRGMKEAVK